MRNKGQNLIEICILFGTVVVVGIMGLMLLGGNIQSIFGNSTEKFKNYEFKNPDQVAMVTPDDDPIDYEGSFNLADPVITANPDTHTVDIDLGDIKISGIPASTSQYISTSGSSGYTDQVADNLDAMVAYLEQLSEAEPDNTDLASMVAIAKEMADKGHIIADSEEWVELAAQRLTSPGALTISDDNLLCQNGNLMSVTPCSDDNDRTITDQDFFFNNNPYDSYTNDMFDMTNGLNNWVEQFSELDSSFASLASTQSEDVQIISNIITTLSGSIHGISQNVKGQIASTEVSDQESLNSNVASITTDVQSSLISLISSKIKEIKERKKE